MILHNNKTNIYIIKQNEIPKILSTRGYSTFLNASLFSDQYFIYKG